MVDGGCSKPLFVLTGAIAVGRQPGRYGLVRFMPWEGGGGDWEGTTKFFSDYR